VSSRQPTQFPLDLEFAPGLGRADFLVAPCNADAFAWIDRWPAWPGTALILYGPEGCGKSHLAGLWAARSGAERLDAAALPVPAPDPLGAAYLLEDADRGTLAETALFHLFNRLAERRGTLLVTARLPVAEWGLRLPDLVSRLKASVAVAVAPPDEATLDAVLLKHLADRRIELDPEALAYLRLRMERSFSGVSRLASAIDRRALAERRAVTIPLLRAVLAETAPQSSEM
jgi:chromosomal replication initiation ATPase DnaA